MSYSSHLTHIENDRVEWDPEDESSLLGRGAFGTVYRGTLDFTTDVAIKVITRCPTDNPEHELRLMKDLKHPNIVQFLRAACSPKTNQTVIVTELLLGGSLHEALELMRAAPTPASPGGARLAEGSFLQIAACIANGLLYLHNKRYTHGDMKPHNVLLTSPVEIAADGAEATFQRNVCAKIADFGLSRSIGKQTTDELMASSCSPDFGPGPVGTFAYMSPQSFNGVANMPGDVAKAADVYAFAIVLFELLSGRQPWKAEGVATVFMLHGLVVNERRRPAWGPLMDAIRPEYREFVEKCWAHDWTMRPSAEEVAKQLRAWSIGFQGRQAGRSPGSAGTAMTPSTSSPVAPRKENYPPGGEDSIGNGEFLRVNTEVVDEDEAKLVRKKVAREPIDIGGSTDTSIRGSGGGGAGVSHGGIGDSVGGIPPIPEYEVSEYSVSAALPPPPPPLPELEVSEYDASSPAPSPSPPPQPTFLSNPIGRSGLDLLNSTEFNNILVPVETKQVLLPEVQGLNLAVPPLAPPSNAGSGADKGAALPISDPMVGPGLSLAVDTGGGKSTESNRKNMVSSFLGAAEKYIEDTERPKANGAPNGFMNPASNGPSHGAKTNGAVDAFFDGGKGDPSHDATKAGGGILDSFDRADLMYNAPPPPGFTPDGTLGLNGLNLENPRKNEAKSSLEDSFFGAARRHNALDQGNGRQEDSGSKVALAESFLRAAQEHNAHEDGNAQQGQGGGDKVAMADSFFRAAQEHIAHEDANGHQKSAGKAAMADSFFRAAQEHNALEETNVQRDNGGMAAMNDSFFRAAQEHNAREEANGVEFSPSEAGFAAATQQRIAREQALHPAQQHKQQNGYLAPNPKGATGVGGKQHRAAMNKPNSGDHDAASRKSSLERARVERKQSNGDERQGKPNVELPSVKIELPNAAPVLENASAAFVGNSHEQYEVTSNGILLNTFADQQPAKRTHAAPFMGQPVSSVSPPQIGSHHQHVSSVSPPQHSAPLQHQMQAPPVSQHASLHNQPLTYGAGVFPGYGHDINMSFVSGGNVPNSNWYRDRRATIGGSGRPAALPTWNGAFPAAPLNVQTAMNAFTCPDATQRLEQYWQAGHRAALASAFVQLARTQLAQGSPSLLSANLHLDIALKFIKLNNNMPSDPLIARDLCVGIGLMAMNRSSAIAGAHALDALPAVLSAMHFNQRDSIVLTAACFALCNLLQVNNHIEDPKLRKAVAGWIVFALSEAAPVGEKNPELAYTACCAARNFMWLRCENAEALVSLPGVLGGRPPLQILVVILRDFREQHYGQAVDAALSALATVAYFPSHRRRIVESGGVQGLCTVLQYASQRANAARVSLSILALLVVEPASADAAFRDECRQALLASNAPSVVLQSLQIATRHAMLTVKEEALSTVVALCEFDAAVCNAVAANKAAWLLADAMGGCVVSPTSPGVAAAIAACIKQLCEAVLAVAKSATGVKQLSECAVPRRLEEMKKAYCENAQVSGVVAKGAAALAERMKEANVFPLIYSLAD